MGRRLGENREAALSAKLHSLFGNSPAEKFLLKEMERYLPQCASFSDQEIEQFVQYQQRVYLHGELPEIGRPVASLNPTFIDSLDALVLANAGSPVYTRASAKENGYRLQLHLGPSGKARAFTRQFTRYDLRLLPELQAIIDALPVMIGDAELINRRHPHLAGFNRLQQRIPDARYWPRKNEEGLEDSFLEAYLNQETLFNNGRPLPDVECTLAFHGLFAIADPATWEESREEQAKNLITTCRLPMNYQTVDRLLSQLEVHLEKKQSPARVVERRIIPDRETLQHYVEEKRQAGLEGVCVVQYLDAEPEVAFSFAKSAKIKNYETIDTALLGLYLDSKDKEEVVRSERITGALLGVYDPAVRQYVPLCKVNLNPDGVQIKTAGQRERLISLRTQLASLVQQRTTDERIFTLYDMYLAHGQTVAAALLPEEGIAERVIELVQNLPRGKDFLALLDEYETHRQEYDSGTRGVKKTSGKSEQYVAQHGDLFSRIAQLREEQAGEEDSPFNQFHTYFSRLPEIKVTSRKLAHPEIAVSTTDPIVLETQAFDIKWALNPFPAGFDTENGYSLRVNNVFAERIRHDKSTTTDYETIARIARANSVGQPEDQHTE